MKQKQLLHAHNYFWNSTKNLVGIVVYYFCQWLILIIIVRIAGYTVSGEFSLVISFTNLFGFISQYNIRSFQLSDKNNKYLPQQYSGAYIITSGLAVVSFFLVLPFSGYNREIIISCMIYMLFKLCETFSGYVFTYMQIEYQYSDIAISSCLKGIVPLIGFVLWLYFTQSLFQSLCIMTLFFFVIIIFYDIKRTRTFILKGFIMEGTIHILKDCFPMMLSALILPFMLFLTRNSVEKVYGVTELGYYTAFTMVTGVISTIAGAVYVVVLPEISDKYIKNLKSDIVRIIFIILGIIIIASLMAVLLARLVGDMVFSFVFGVEILDYMYLLIPVIITSVMVILVSFFSICLVAMKKRLVMLVGMLPGVMFLSFMVMPATQKAGMLGTTNIFTLSLFMIIVIYSFIIHRYLCNSV